MTQERDSKFIGAEKHITFGGRTSGGVNIPGGLRAPKPTSKANGHPTRRNHPAPSRSAPAPVGWDRNITFGGSTSPGINIPGGLRMPAPRVSHQASQQSTRKGI